MGEMLWNPKDMNEQFRQLFGLHGFRELKDYYTIELPNYDLKIENAYKQVDFSKDRVLVEVQFGKYFKMFYDMALFQYFFNMNKIDVGVEIVPAHTLQKNMSSGVSYGEHVINDIIRLERHFPAVPVKIILIDVDRPTNTLDDSVGSPSHSK